MRASITAELLVISRRPSTWILLSVWAALAVLFSYVLPYLDEEARGQSPLSQLFPFSLTGQVLSGFPFFGGVFALMLGVIAVGSEYGSDTLKTLFTQGPGRLAVFAAKVAALGIVLVLLVLTVFVAGAASSYVIAQLEDAPVEWPSAWLLVRGLGAGWLIMAVWGALGVLLAVLSRATAVAIGVGILYTLVLEGLVSALVEQVSVLEPLVELFVRANAYSLVAPLGLPLDGVNSNGPGAFSGPFVASGQALAVLTTYLLAFLAISALLLRRRDVA